jgi:regulator of sigma E protease
MEALQTVKALLIVIGVMVVVHELGHYWAARLFDVKIEAFSIGFGPRLFGMRRGETDWKVCLIPLGGYVKMSGELPGEEGSDDPRSFLNKPRWQRMVIAFAGPLMNAILSVAIMTVLFMNHHEQAATLKQPARVGFVEKDSPAAKGGLERGDLIVRVGEKENPTWEEVNFAALEYMNAPMPVLVERGGQTRPLFITPVLDDKRGPLMGWDAKTTVTIDAVGKGSAADQAGLKPGDQFVSIAGTPIETLLGVHEKVRNSEGKPLEIVYLRNGREGRVTVTPRFEVARNEKNKRYLLGIEMSVPTVVGTLGPWDAFQTSLAENRRFAGLLYNTLHGMITARLSPKQLEGPIGIARAARRAEKEGFLSTIFLMSMVSMNLAIFNLLPIPILDGGVILLLLVEMIQRKDLSLQAKEMVFRVGFAFLMFLVVFVFYNDIAKLIQG